VSFDWRRELPHWALVGAMFALGVLSWPEAPDRIPVHWNLAGEVDRWGGRFEGLFAVPLMGAGVYLLLLFVPRIDPGRANYASFRQAYDVVRLSVLVVLAAVHASMNASLHGLPLGPPTVVPLAVGALLIVLGNFMGKFRPNWFVGIRTPWTLSSAQSWSRTHRAGGWVFVAGGLLLMAAAALPWLVVPALVVVVGGSLGLVAFSYVAWKADPDKRPPAGRSPA